ncbi:TPA: hypothetical protein EYP12_03755 [Candidatus Bipolaricaulota bacterium]|nr:hypothetical protein [Candidatus Bipolaricaulota bacterium]
MGDCGNGWAVGIKIAVVAALKCELRPLRRKIGNKAIYHALGIGRENVMSELPRFIAQHKPEILILTGFSGGLQPGLESGMPILATALSYEGSRGEISLEDRFFGLAAEALEAAQIPFLKGKILTVEGVVTSPEEKNRLWRDFSALAVEMEGWWAAQAVGTRPLICLKAIVDPAEWELPWGLAAAAQTGWEWALLHPREWPGLLRLGRAAKCATEALTEAVACTVAALAQAPLESEVAR